MNRRPMSVPHNHSRRILGAYGAAAALALLAPQGVRADQVYLRGGGSLQGLVLPVEGDVEKVQVLTRTSPRPFEFRKDQILRVEPEDDELREYLRRRDAGERETGQAEYELGLWCEENGLRGPSEVHYRRAVELDPELGEAQKKLGRVQHNGRWVTYDELREAQGLVKHKGKWIAAREKEQLASQEEFNASQESWARRLRLLRQKWLAADPADREEAEAQLAAIREPEAVAPLVHTFGADSVTVRMRLAELVAAVPGDEATDALIRLVLVESEPEVRQHTLQQLRTRHDLEAVPKFVRALASKDPIVVGRAAWALGMLDAVSAVPKLIPVLVKVERRMVVDPVAAAPAPGINAAFTSVGPGPIFPGGGGLAVGGAAGVVPPAGYVGGGTSIPVLTGPVVGPGVAAFGARSVPFGTGVAMGVGGGGVNPNRPVSRIESRVFRNEAVLEALQKLTGQDFGYDQAAWRRWLGAGFRPEPEPVRHVPQP